MRKLISGSSIDLGVCYYPEHWERRFWAEDLDPHGHSAGMADGKIS